MDIRKRRKAAFTLIEIIFYMVLFGLIISVAMPDAKKLLTRGQLGTIRQQQGEIQKAVNAWVGEQPTLADAASNFADIGGGVMGPIDQAAFISAISRYMMKDTDQVFISNGKITTNAMQKDGRYVVITWPMPYRDNYIHVALLP